MIQKMTKYNHGEAFCLMEYQCETCGYKEIIWNSRDGVTPFIIRCPECQKKGIPIILKSGLMEHVNWQKDQCAPDYLPDQGQRVFVDITPQIMEVLTRARVRRQWNEGSYPMSDRWDDPIDAVKELSEIHEGEPYIITI